MFEHHHVDATDKHVIAELTEPRPVLSSAVLNGGSVMARNLLIMRVDSNADGSKTGFDHPRTTLQEYADELDFQGPTVGMMTSASMDSFRMRHEVTDGISMSLLLTSGISNARCAGDPAECRHIATEPPAGGTINIMFGTSARLTQSAMVECVMMITEAKTAALQREGVQSGVSPHRATGTGTDAVAVVSGIQSTEISYCGKHTMFGEIIARMTISALRDSLNY